MRHYLQLLERLNAAAVSESTPRALSDPMSSLGHAVWRFLLRRAAGRRRA